MRVLLLKAQWTSLAPRAAIALWQTMALASSVALVALCVLLTSMSRVTTPHRRPVTDFSAGSAASHSVRSVPLDQSYGMTIGIVVAVLLLGTLAFRAAGLVRAGGRHRALLDLVAVELAEAPGTMVLDHPQAAAYSLAGLRPRVVVSRGAVDALSSEELAAVLAHEKAHLRARHDLVLLPFRCVTSLFPQSRSFGAVSETMHELVEMAADDQAIRQCGSSVLAQAICRMATAGCVEASPVPPGAGAVPPRLTKPAERLVFRIERTRTAYGNKRVVAFGTGLTAVGVAALPLAVLWLPLAGR
jgi:hypothetical protein